VLVLDENGYVVGKLSQSDVLRALEKPYREVTRFDHSRRFGFSYKFIKSVADNYHDFERPLDKMFTRAGQITVEEAMYVPTQGEFVREDASLDEAIYLLAKGRHQSLLVVNDEGVSGILRLSDVFSIISKQIKSESE
jgi:CBS domain-containing protein